MTSSTGSQHRPPLSSLPDSNMLLLPTSHSKVLGALIFCYLRDWEQLEVEDRLPTQRPARAWGQAKGSSGSIYWGEQKKMCCCLQVHKRQGESSLEHKSHTHREQHTHTTHTSQKHHGVRIREFSIFQWLAACVCLQGT